MRTPIVLTLLTLAHLGLFRLLPLEQSAGAGAREAGMSVVAAAPVAAAMPPVNIVAPEIEIAVEPMLPDFETEEILPTTGTAIAANLDCQLTTEIGAALQSDVRARQAIAALPSSTRSVANTAMLWDGRWADDAKLGGHDVLGPIRRAVVGAIAAAAPTCRSAPIVGPRIVIVMTENKAVVLAFGSGDWSWAQLSP